MKVFKDLSIGRGNEVFHTEVNAYGISIWRSYGIRLVNQNGYVIPAAAVPAQRQGGHLLLIPVQVPLVVPRAFEVDVLEGLDEVNPVSADAYKGILREPACLTVVMLGLKLGVSFLVFEEVLIRLVHIPYGLLQNLRVDILQPLELRLQGNDVP